jgi:hypothetical protein
MSATSFPVEVKNRLQFYVYRLIDPRNGETFYIGKGVGDRVFQHAQAELNATDFDDETDISAKLGRIREIRREGLDVLHVIQRHGLTKEEAFLVEGALIDVFPGLTNLQGGHGNSEFGAMHAETVISRYVASRLVLAHRAIFLTVGKAFANERGDYEACRGVWKLGRSRASQAELVMPVVEGRVTAVFRPTRWLDATPEHFPNHVEQMLPDRIGFEGVSAEEDVRRLYVGKRLPDELVGRRKSQNPIRYSY